MSIKICCDFCNKPLPLELDSSVYAFTSKPVKTKELDTRKLFPHLCKECAYKLDQTLILARKTWLKQADISHRNTELNNTRRALLGTKG